MNPSSAPSAPPSAGRFARPRSYGWASILLAGVPFIAVLIDRNLTLFTGDRLHLELRDILPWLWLLATACGFTAFFVHDRRHRAPVSRGRALGVLGASVLALLLVWPFEVRLHLRLPPSSDVAFGPTRHVVGTGPVIDVLGIALPGWRGRLDEWKGLPDSESYALFPQEQIYAGQRYLEGEVRLAAFPAKLTCPVRGTRQWLFWRHTVFYAHYGDPRRGELLARLRAAGDACVQGLQPPDWFLPHASEEERQTVFGAKVLPAGANSITVQWFELAAAQGKVGQILTEPWARQRYTAYGRYLLYANLGEAAADVLPVAARASTDPSPPSGAGPVAMARTLSVPFQPDWEGGWRAADHAYAVRMCNPDYARFLHARGLNPDPVLLPTLARALQEPTATLGLSAHGDAPTPALYRMPETRLPRCQALLSWLQALDPARFPPKVMP